MPKVKKIILNFLCLSFIFYLLSFIFSPVSAQPILEDNTVKVNQEVNTDGEVLGWLDDLFNWFVNIFAEKKIPEDVRNYDQASLPPISIEREPPPQDQQKVMGLTTDKQAAASNEDSFTDTVHYYGLTKGINTPEQKDIAGQSLWDRIIGKLFGDLLDQGNQDAEDLVGARTPPGVAKEILTRANYNRSLALMDKSADSNVLAAASEQRQMADAVDAARCAELPPGVGDCLNSGLLNPPESPTPTPEVSAEVSPPSEQPISPPSECGGVAGPNDYYMDESLGKCPIMTKGNCSVSCLKPYFENSQKLAEIASQICQAESGGDPFIISRRNCLLPDVSSRTQEYSVGLFQINLWFDERCSGALINQFADFSRDPPYFSCQEGPNFDQCTRDFQDPVLNYTWAYKLYNKRKTYFPGENPWYDWSTAKPGPSVNNCDIKP